MTLVPASSFGGGSVASSGAITLLSTTTLAVDGTFDVSGLAQTYTDLLLVVFARGTRAATNDSLRLQLNNDSTTVYDNGQDASGTFSNNFNLASALIASIPAASATSGWFACVEVTIINYTSATLPKTILSACAGPVTSATTVPTFLASCIWRNASPAAVNRVGLFGGTTANLLAGSVLRIYGRT